MTVRIKSEIPRLRNNSMESGITGGTLDSKCLIPWGNLFGTGRA